jgi:hypothetical protein
VVIVGVATNEKAPMLEAFDTAAGSRLVWGKFGYLDNPGKDTVLYMYEDGAPPRPQAKFRMVPKQVRDLRHHMRAQRTRLDTEGFELLSAPSAVDDFWSDEEVRRNYYPELQELVLRLTGGNRAFVFDHQCRRREPDRGPLGFGRSGDGSKPGAVGRVHNDYSEASGQARLAKVIEEVQLRDTVRAYCIVNVWRPIVGPVLDTPLALCDARTVSKRDLHACEIRYPHRSGEIYLLTDSPRHVWMYCSDMQPTEVLVFKQFDSRADVRGRFVPHAAFDLPDIDAAVPPRQSIEARCLVAFNM